MKIEFTAEDRNIIRFAIEEKLRDETDEIRAEILRLIYEKLKLLQNRELKDGTREQSIFL